jgi:hypothetical protein
MGETRMTIAAGSRLCCSRLSLRTNSREHPRHHGRRHRLEHQRHNRGQMGCTPNIDRIANEVPS